MPVTNITQPARHGLTLRAMVLHAECPDAAAALLADFTEKYQPTGPVEHHIVEMLAVFEWQMLRAQGIQQGYFNIAAARHADKILDGFEAIDPVSRATENFRHMVKEDDTFRLLLRYIAELRRCFNAKLRELQTAQNWKTPAEPKPVQAAPGKEASDTRIEPNINPLTPRNAACPCGSGEKFKRCCGPKAPPVLGKAA